MSDISVDPVFQYPSNAMDVAGLDLSLTATGIATRRGTQTIKVNPKHHRQASRLIYLRDRILHAIRHPALAVIEGYSYASPNQGPQMGELGGIIRVALHEAGVPYVVVAPTSLKKYATNNGHASKEQVLVAAVRCADDAFDDNNQADAWWLRDMGMTHYFPEKRGSTQYRSEVLDRIEWPEL